MPRPVPAFASSPDSMDIGVESTLLLPFLAGNPQQSVWVPIFTPKIYNLLAQKQITLPPAVTRFGARVHQFTNYQDLIKVAAHVGETDKKKSSTKTFSDF